MQNIDIDKISYRLKFGISNTPRYRPKRPKGAKDEVKKPLAAKLAASKADHSRPRQTIADYSRPRQTMADQSILISAVLLEYCPIM